MNNPLIGLSPEVQIALIICTFACVCLACVVIFAISSSPGRTHNFCAVVKAFERFLAALIRFIARRRKPTEDPPDQDAA